MRANATREAYHASDPLGRGQLDGEIEGCRVYLGDSQTSAMTASAQ